MKVVTKILSSLEARMSQPRLSIWRTFYVNFRLLPFKKAIKLPIFIYGKVRLFILSGNIEFSVKIYRGLIKIGKNTESFALFDHSGFLQINPNCTITFNGPAEIGVNSKIRLVSSNLNIGKNAFIASGVRIIGNGADINIGENCRIAFETVIMNSSFHYMYNTDKHGYGRCAKPISIGSKNWIGNRSTISGGTVTKDSTIVASGSLLNRDYTKFDGIYPLLGGTPAKILATGVKRVFSPKCHNKISEWFKNNPNARFYDTDEITDEIKDLDVEF